MLAYARAAPAVRLWPCAADQWTNPLPPHAVPAPLLLLCSGLRTAPGLYKIACSSTARIRLVTALVVRAAPYTARTASHTATAPPPLRRGMCTVPCRRQNPGRSRAALLPASASGPPLPCGLRCVQRGRRVTR